MHFNRRCHIEKGKLDIAPLMDVVLLLLIFFMLSSSMIMPAGLRINLPGSPVSEPQEGRRLTVEIDREGRCAWQGEQVEMKELGEHFAETAADDPDARVVLKADREVSHGRVVEVMSAAHETGLTKLSIAVAPERKGEGRGERE